jgi:hypothetical protein
MQIRAVGGDVLYVVRPGTAKELSEWLAVEVVSRSADCQYYPVVDNHGLETKWLEVAFMKDHYGRGACNKEE